MSLLGIDIGTPCKVGLFAADGKILKIANRATVVSRCAPTIFQRIRERIAAGEPSSISDEMLARFSRLSVPVVGDAAPNNDPVASTVLHETSAYFDCGYGVGPSLTDNEPIPHQGVGLPPLK